MIRNYPWIYGSGPSFTVNCFMWRTVPDARGTYKWYRINSHSDGRYVGRTIQVGNTTLGEPEGHGIPQCG